MHLGRLAARLVVPVCLVGSAAGCSSNEPSATAHEADGGESGSTPAPPNSLCEYVDQLPEAEKQLAAELGAAALREAGKNLAQAWVEPVAFALFQQAAYKAIGCDLTELGAPAPGRIEQGLHADTGPDYYCGPGHGADRLVIPAVSECLNQACRDHDACYAQCSERTSGKCMWGGPTSPCDDRLMQAVQQCSDDSHQFGSFLVRFLANGLYASASSALGCPDDMVCPGNGPCQQDPDSEACSECLDRRDIEAACRQHACSDDPDVTTCYTANCPSLSGCYGGYDLPPEPTPAEQNPPAVELSSLWSLSVVQAIIPERKSSGEPWDVDLSAFARPDVSIGVRVGDTDAARFDTAVADDSFRPTWAETPALVPSVTAWELQNYLEFSAVDRDVAFDDPIGACSTALTPSDFDGRVLRYECPEGSETSFEVYYTLSPAQ